MSETIELKPCAHCGDKAKLGEDELAGWVDCPTCGACIIDDHNEPTIAAQLWNRRHTDAAPGEAELGRELIAWAAERANAYACDPYTVPFCLFCGLLDGHTPTCLHLRARALRDSDES